MKVAGKISSITAQQNPTRGLTFAFNQISKQVLQFFFVTELCKLNCCGGNARLLYSVWALVHEDTVQQNAVLKW